MTVEIRRGTARFESRVRGRLTRHSFSFGERYDPDNVSFGPLVCHDDHLLAAGQGFEKHHHADVDIVTWVVTGALRSEPGGVLEPGSLAITHAGDGITHAEVADAPGTRFVQAWLRSPPGSDSGTPSREVLPVSAGPGLTVACELAGATLSLARLAPGATITLGDAPLQHVYVVTGALARSSLAEPLAAGDAFRITDRPGLVLTAAAPTELMVWDFAS
jgi:redox-sensitive bicupin YhaK (pirin superfamily)